jgi:hypothetical protein
MNNKRKKMACLQIASDRFFSGTSEFFQDQIVSLSRYEIYTFHNYFVHLDLNQSREYLK